MFSSRTSSVGTTQNSNPSKKQTLAYLQETKEKQEMDTVHGFCSRIEHTEASPKYTNKL